MGNTTSTTEISAEPVQVSDAAAETALRDARARRDAGGDSSPGNSRPPSLNTTPQSSSHGGNNFTAQLAAANAQAQAPAPPPMLGNSTHGGLSFWNWSHNRTPDAPVTPNTVTPGNSTHGGNSLWNWGVGRESPAVSAPPSRNASQHKGAAFSAAIATADANANAARGGTGSPTAPLTVKDERSSSVHGGGILRNVNWPGLSPSTSRSASTHGGVHFAKHTFDGAKSRERSGSLSGDLWNWGKGREQGAPGDPKEEEEEPPAPVPMKRNNSLSAMWDWGIGRESPQATPAPSRESSQHGGNATGGSPKLKLARSNSLSSMWNWSLGRETPPITPGASREASVHNGSSDEGKVMPWSIKIQFGSDKERPV